MATIDGGDRLSRALADIARHVDRPATLKVGFLENATYPSGKNAGIKVALVAALNEFGTGRAPPRPFFRNMIRKEASRWPAALGVNLIANHYDAARSLDDMGDAIKGQLQLSIRDLWSPPLAQSTIDRKGFDKPLIETSHMLNSVDYVVTVR